ncbi:hypothetical protein GJAV_G00027650 [Gymnothorax javanicus]|nr:hypothetical protein GJAV_G00027650 [Gymnothorax javanicus]
MTTCLYECLYEAGLQRYYPQFTAMGLSRLAHLSQLTMGDYPRLGVQDMGDRTRLFHLVQLVKDFAEEESEGCVEEDRAMRDGALVSSRRPPPRRQLDFSAFSPEPEGRQVVRNYRGPCKARKDWETPFRSIPGEKESCKQGACIPTATPVLSAGAVKERVVNSGRVLKATPHGNCSNRVRTERRWAELSCRKSLLEQAPVYQVQRAHGYNYGLPMTSPSSSTRSSSGRAGAERIRVCVRKRPLSRAEEKRGEADVITVRDGGSVLVHEQKEAVDLTQYVLQHEFYFDEVFSEMCTNEDVYERTAYPLIQHIFNGGKATCFAYGQTGAGKTHTMLGSSARRPGLYALAARDIFARLVQQSEPRSGPGPLSVCVSFFEIYCGQLYDLLNHRKRLFAREDGQRVVQIAGLREVGVESVTSLLEVISSGSRERSRGVSGVNCDSSRSHALLQIHLRARSHQLVGRISFVDLAGSERACDSRDSDRQGRMEGAEINQSLLALKECIRALDQELSHTPFRQSKLTQVLKDSFIGNSKTCMIANISPSHLATEHTLNTLRYADRVKELKKGGKSLQSTPSPKRNQHLSREKSHTKKVKLGGQREPRDSRSSVRPVGVLFSPGANLVCSTPKPQGEAWQEVGRAGGEVCLHHTTPLRGTLGSGRGNGGPGRVQQKERREEEGGSKEGEGGKREARTRAQPVWKETVPRETLRGHTSTRIREREQGRVGEREEMERERHLRRYHEHLQQFLPLAAVQRSSHSQNPLRDLLLQHSPRQPSPAEQEQASRLCSGLSMVLDFGHGSGNDPGEHNPTAAGADVSQALSGWGKGEDEREMGQGGQDLQGMDLDWVEGQPAGEGVARDQEGSQGFEGIILEYGDRLSTDSSTAEDSLGLREEWDVPGEQNEVEESREREREREVARENDGSVMSEWSTEEEDCSTYLSTESSSSNNNIPAERPLSPPRHGAVLLAGRLNDLSDEPKCSNSHPQEELGSDWAGGDRLSLHFGSLSKNSVNIPPCPSVSAVTVPQTGCSRSESRNLDSTELPTTSPASPAGCPAVGTSVTRVEPHKSGDSDIGLMQEVDMPLGSTPPTPGSSPCAAESSASTMDPLSISLLQVERQAATDSFLRPSSCSPCASPVGDSAERSGAEQPHLLLEALLDIQTYWSQLESAVAPDGQKEQLTLDLDSAVQSMKGVSATKDPSLSLTPFPGSFLETSAQPESSVLDFRKATVPSGVPQTQAPPGMIGSNTCPSRQDQSELSPTEACPIKPTSLTEKSSGDWKETSGGSILTEPRHRDGQCKPDALLGRVPLGRQSLSQDNIKTGAPRKPQSITRDPYLQSNPSVTTSHPRRSSTARQLHEGLGPAQRLVVQAHCEQLEEMDSLCRKEEALLSLQPSLDFTDYVLRLEEILELKAKCVRCMRAQLQLYLTCSNDSHTLAS